MASSTFFNLNMAIYGFFPQKNLLDRSHPAPRFFLLPSGKNSPQNKH